MNSIDMTKLIIYALWFMYASLYLSRHGGHLLIVDVLARYPVYLRILFTVGFEYLSALSSLVMIVTVELF